eukprot:jgi/Botrbrau1/12187/Bobra.0186s0094.1
MWLQKPKWLDPHRWPYFSHGYHDLSSVSAPLLRGVWNRPPASLDRHSTWWGFQSTLWIWNGFTWSSIGCPAAPLTKCGSSWPALLSLLLNLEPYGLVALSANFEHHEVGWCPSYRKLRV